MTALPLALSISNTLLKAGALAAVAGLVGIAVLSLLVFSQARELKRLREWAGRAPERAAELDRSLETLASGENPRFGQRVSAEAAIRIQRTVQPVPRPPGAAVPRVTPVIARASTAEPAASVAGAVALTAAGEPVPGQPLPIAVAPGEPVPVTTTPAQPAAAGGAPVPGQPAFVPTAQPAVAAAAQPAPSSNGPGPAGQPATVAGSALAAADSKPVEGGEPTDAQKPVSTPTAEEGAPEPAQVASSDAQSEPAVAEAKPEPAVSEPEPVVAEAEPSVPAPVTVAALAAASGSAAVASRVLEPAHSAAARATAQPAPARAPTPPPTRPPLPPRPSAPPRAAAGSPGPTRPSASARPGREWSRGREEGAGFQGRGETGFQFLREEEPPPRRATALIVGGVVVGVAVLAVVLLSLGGGSSNKSPGSTQGSATASGAHGGPHSPVVASPAETHVVVLNATETNGLAHQLSGNLQRSGYTLASALSGAPPARSTSVVEYANGHRTEAQHVGQTLGIGEVQPLEGGVAPLVGSATVVVIAGADQAAAGTSTGASSGAGAAGAGEAVGGATG